MQVSAAVRKMQEEVEARQRAEAAAARLAEEQRIRVGGLHCMIVVLLAFFVRSEHGLYVCCIAYRVLQCTACAAFT